MKNRPIGIFDSDADLLSKSENLSASISVSIGPGCIEFARIFSTACCTAVYFVNDLTPPFDAP